ncbi:MAG: hypothetical protein ACLVJH_15350 [Faecalibacterium prausnitzii]
MKRLTEIMDYPSEYETAEGVKQSELDKVEGDIEFKDVYLPLRQPRSRAGSHQLHHSRR